MNVFDPAQFGFVQLIDFEFPGGVSVYEYKNHSTVDGKPDFLRLNFYLSKDRNYVTIWNGLLEPLFTEIQTKSMNKPTDFDLGGKYNEDLFRGHIETSNEAAYILRALRISAEYESSFPQILSADSDNKLRCEVMDTAR